jgi:subfamily B ATP-binding cassette protein MsbA
MSNDNSAAKKYMRMLQFIKPYYKLFAITILLTLIVVFLEAITLWFSGSLLGMIFKNSQDVVTMEKPPLSLSTVNELLKYYTWYLLSSGGENDILGVLKKVCLLIPVLFLFKDGFIYIRNVVMSYLNLSVVEGMRTKFYKHILSLPMEFYDKNSTGSVTSYLVRDLNVVRDSLSKSINLLIMEPFKLIVFFGLLLVINFKLTALILISYPIIAFFLGKAGKVIRRRSKAMLSSFSEIVAVITETISGVRLVKTFHGENYELTKFKKLNRDYTKKAVRERMITAALSPFNEFVSLSLTSLLIWYGGKEALSSTSSFGSEDFLRFLLLLFAAYTPIKKLVNIQGVINNGIAAADRIFEVFDTSAEDVAEENVASFKKEVTFESVTFSYPNYDEIVLDDISFSVKKGEMVALVGSSGSGKSTILDILPRFYEIPKGDIKVDGISTKELSLYSLRSLFGVVSQDTILFDDSIAVNIAYGSTPIDFKKLETTLKAANAQEFISKLPDGIDTVIGERGVTLSGGQRQRLAIARALYKNPDILILDEATSSLDTESEKSVQQAIDILIKDRTTIVVAHRLSTIMSADTILVLDKGKIVERGSHKELLSKNGRYRELHDIQFS